MASGDGPEGNARKATISRIALLDRRTFQTGRIERAESFG